MTSIVENVVYQHAENACSLWLQRQYAVNEPHYSFADIAHLDNRLDANVEGLRVAGHHAFPMIDEMMDAEDEGAWFTKALLLLQAGDQTRFNALIQRSQDTQDPDAILRELESALAWADPAHLKDCVKTLLSADDSASIVLGLKTCASHNRDPILYLEKYLDSDSPLVRETVLHVAANCGASKLVNGILNGTDGESEREYFERGRALAMLGKQDHARRILSRIALSDSVCNSDATALHGLLNDVKASKSLLRKLNDMPTRQRDVVHGFGLIGDPAAMDWLISKTEIPEYARLAGGAITMITGVDLADNDLETLDAPAGFEDGGITDDPEDNAVALDEDEDLPWPDHELVSAWWNSSPKLAQGRCFLAGRERTQPELVHILANGMQRQRNVAAMSLALLNPESRYLDTRLPTNKQTAWVV